MSCNSKKEILSLFEEKYTQYHLNDFPNINERKSMWLNEYNLYTNDSSEILNFTYFTDNTDTHKEGDLVFGSYSTKHIENDTVRIHSYSENRELLYSFKHKSNYFLADSSAIFTAGKYYYLYNFEAYKLTTIQIEYYEKNMDSIIHNKVNTLPDL